MFFSLALSLCSGCLSISLTFYNIVILSALLGNNALYNSNDADSSNDVQARSQDFCKGGTRRWRDRRSRARRGGAKRRSAEGVRSGEGRRSPSPVWGSGGVGPRKFLKNQRWNCTFSFRFYQRDSIAKLSAGIAIALLSVRLCPSVRLSHASCYKEKY